MKTEVRGLEFDVQLTKKELKRLKSFPIEGKTDNAHFTLACRKEQRELLELNGRPYWNDKAKRIDATINNAYYRELKDKRGFEVRYHSGARKFKISIID